MMRQLALLIGFTCLLSFWTLAQNGAAPSDSAIQSTSIEGRVINALTGQPVRNVNLTLVAMPSSGGTVGGRPPQNVAVVSDAQGHFKFENLEAGRYLLSGVKTGYVQQQYGARIGQPGTGSPITLELGEAIKDVEFKLTPQGVISGKVLNEDGEPLSRVSIEVFRQPSYFSRATSMVGRNIMGTTTNDVGQFLIGNLAPGKYILRADRGFPGDLRIQAPSGEGAQVYVATFYPNAADIESATPITINAGEEVSGIEIWLQKGRVYSVRGRVLGASDDKSGRIQVSLDPQKRPPMNFSRGVGSIAVKPDGSFEFASVVPGSYFVTAVHFPDAPGGQLQTVGRVPVSVANGDVTDLIVHLAVPVRLELEGTIAVEADEHAKVNGTVFLQAAEPSGFFGPGIPPARIQSDGTFRLERVSPGKYYINVVPLPEGTYLKQVKAGDADVLESGLDVPDSGSVPRLEILVGSKAATIEGVVRDEDKPWPGASIALLPDSTRPEMIRRLQKSSVSGQDGRFTLKGIAPGNYWLTAWEEFVPVADLDPEELKPYESYVVKIKVDEGDRQQVELKLAKPQ